MSACYKELEIFFVCLVGAVILFTAGLNFGQKAKINVKYYQEYKVIKEKDQYFIDPYKWDIIEIDGEIITVRSKESYKSTELDKLKSDIY